MNIDEYFNNKRKDITIDINKKDITFQILDWWAKDEYKDDNDEDSDDDDMNISKDNHLYYSIYMFGKTEENYNITCKINNYYPYYYIKVINSKALKPIINYIQSKLSNKNALIIKKCESVIKKDIFGFRNDKYYTFIKVVFRNLTDLNRSKYLFKNPIVVHGANIKPMKYKLYESSFEPFLKFCHETGIQTANWVNISNYTKEYCINTSTLNIQCDFNSTIIKKVENNKIANYLQASWDIEVYSFDGQFPDPNKKSSKGEYPNVIYQMATTFKYFNESKMIKHLLTLKKCNKIESTTENETIIVEYFPNEKDLLKRWIDLIKISNPDIIYTYNGDSFDWRYLKERCEIYKITDYLYKNTSRLSSFKSEMKKEVFSSSAYGDNEFHRVYIPGRLNYDLLIHYKRGIKKYSSYKLDNIAYEILKEKKNNVTVKQIFEYYENGDPEKMKIIGEYNIQDTVLLQKLVDNQLILITIIQLANVTYVPISYLVTKGQTIKVNSQLIRKASQMNFLVPNTNFNEDTYPIHVKLRDPITQEGYFKVNDFAILESHNINNTNSNSKWNSNQLNCKISEIIDEQNIILLTNTEISQIYYTGHLTYNNKKIQISKIFSINETLDDTFTGACVLDASIGMYHKDNIAVLDFASLYPTIIMSRNLCYSTFVIDSQFDNIENINYKTISWEDSVEYKLNHTCQAIMKSGKKKNEICGKQAYFDVDQLPSRYFCRVHDPIKKERPENEKFQKKHVDYSFKIVQPNSDGKFKGVLPSLLEELYSERKKVKKQMAIALENGDKLYADILDKTQLGIKISLNSCYGFLGRKQGNMILKELGSIVTAVGRQLIEQTKNYAEGEFSKYIKENNKVMHTIQLQDISNLSENDKSNILKQFTYVL